MSIISRKIDGITVGQKRKDGYVNATALCSAHNKATGQNREAREWLSNRRTEESIDHLSLKTGIPRIKLVAWLDMVVLVGKYTQPDILSALQFVTFCSPFFCRS